jgi:hypothetical protein
MQATREKQFCGKQKKKARGLVVFRESCTTTFALVDQAKQSIYMPKFTIYNALSIIASHTGQAR